MLLPAAYRRLEQRVASRLLIAPVTAHLTPSAQACRE